MTLTRRRFLTGTAAMAATALGAGACTSPATANPGRTTLKNYAVVMAGTLVAILPLVIVFLIGARHFACNIAAGALKG